MLRVAQHIMRCANITRFAPCATSHLFHPIRHCVSSSSTPPIASLLSSSSIRTHLELDTNVATTEGRSWITIVPQHISQHPRSISRQLRVEGKYREAHAVLRKAGFPLTRHQDDLIEFLSVLLKTDEFNAPCDRLHAMVEAIWKAPIQKPKKAFNLLLSACFQEASRVSGNSSFKREVTIKTAEMVWHELSHYSSGPDHRAIALMYQICGECNDLPLARQIRDQCDQPTLNRIRAEPQNEHVTAAYIFCLGKCRKPYEAEALFFSESGQALHTSSIVLSALFRAYLASNRVSKAESMIPMHGTSFLNIQSCNAFIKQCSSLRLFDRAMNFLDRMERTAQTSFPPPTARTYNLLLRGLSSAGVSNDSLITGRALQVVDKMKAQGIKPTIATYNTLIRNFVQRGKLGDAMYLFSAVAEPNRQTFNHLMQGAARNRDLRTADHLLALLKKQGEPPTYGLCKSYLRTVAQFAGVEEAFSRARNFSKLFRDMLVLGDVGAEESLRMALISACGKAGDLKAAFRALSFNLSNERPVPGSSAALFVGTVLMQACLDCGKPGQALEVFDTLRSTRLELNFEVYEGLIYGLSAYIRDHNDEGTDSPLGQANFNQEVYDNCDQGSNMTTKDCPDTWSDVTIEFARTEAGDANANEIFKVTLMLLREMHERGIARSNRTASFVYNTLVAAAASLNEFDLAMEIFRRMTRHSNAKVLYVSAEHMRELIEVGIGHTSTNERIWSELDGCDHLPPANVNTYNSMIAAAQQCGRIDEALMIFERMETDRETEPDAATLILLADIGLSNDATFSVAQAVLKVLDRSSVAPRLARKRVRLRQKVLALRWAG